MRKFGGLWSIWHVAVFVAPVWLSAQTVTTLATFDGPNGANPNQTLVQGFDGSFYGTTYHGGSNEAGTVFQVSASGVLTTLHNFSSVSGGGFLPGNMTLGFDGDFYGLTNVGGTGQAGTAYKVTPAGAFTTLFNDPSTGPGPFEPLAILQGYSGNFYGTSFGGGANGAGTVFKMTPEGVLTIVFGNFPHGTPSVSAWGLIQARDGDFYGTTSAGIVPYNYGSIFKLTPSGFTSLYQFDGTDGWAPAPTLVQGSDGNFYGVTELGGPLEPYFGNGTFFRITPQGVLTNLYYFSGGVEGSEPNWLVEGTDGNFYGTAYSGGASNYGVIFKITPEGAYTNLYSFANAGDGEDPDVLIQGTDGNFYGATYGVENDNNGTIFRLSVGLAPFVRTVQSGGPVGETVTILGTDLTGATGVSFHGVAAQFTVISPTEIRTVVPSGASTGRVQVATPTGTLSTPAGFVVIATP
jgi:uncharacterized repeat protein (TIGR03803 family)